MPTHHITWILLPCLYLVSQEAYAYFDPGTGSLLIQLLLAIIGSVVVFSHKIIFEIKKIPAKLKSFIAKNSQRIPTLNRHRLLAAAIGAYVSIFYVSHNIDQLTFAVIASNILFFIFFSLLLTLYLAFVLRKRKQKEKILHGLLFLLFIYYMRIPTKEYITSFLLSYVLPYSVYINDWFVLHIIIFIAMIIIYAVFFYLGWKLSQSTIKVMLILAIMSLFPVYNLLIGAYQHVTEEAVLEEHTPRSLLHADDMLFQKKPNVYFILFDSYTNREGLKIFDLHPTHDISDKLAKLNFTVYPFFYTNLQPTTNALPTYLQMDIKYGGKFFYKLLADNKSKIIAGDNPVFELFKKNGYRTEIISPFIYEDDYCFADKCFTKENTKFMFTHFHMPDSIILNNMFRLLFSPVSGSSSLARMQTLDRITQSTEKHFVYAHFNRPGHAPLTWIDSEGTCNEQEETEQYAQRVSKTNSLILHIADMIVTQDHDALIILASDHGPYILNRCSGGAPLLTREEVIERQGAFLAIKWGHGYDGRFAKNIKSSVNLFRYIFSHLADNKDFLANKPADDAFYLYKGKVIKSIADGMILPSPAANNSYREDK